MKKLFLSILTFSILSLGTITSCADEVVSPSDNTCEGCSKPIIPDED